MEQAKKFGTFGGVFTPSILTILGVIMYMRLPWIVGQAGFFVTVGIILVAHIVSISTGLSVSSIATDKKVKAGGTYYIISRSLGLPIGGTLGVALFFGLSLSVSLYLIGFSESFLGFWGLEITKDTIRITGTIALIIVGTLTFISTSLAIKTQYFIMAAIGLSLVTIIFGNTDFVPVQPLLNPIPEMSPIILLFAIFFPAVTGFEAGVSMSGDLKDAKKSIPFGTIAAIGLGLIVYIALAGFFAYRVDSDQLVNNPNILLELSFFPPLLVAGIWGATISSAIGSILGAPRILQATSSDRITPKIFAKGFGKTNEPRNALLLTFVIAEAGIMIGELNLIARVVSMFFITTYGFLNLSSALEKWASTDFRPSFKIPTTVSIIGAIVCFILMMELDFVALIGASIIMGLIFLYLKRKELTLESGDTWEGVWASILRAGLNRLNRTVKQQRNWRPNIILFSGGSTARPHLIEFGRWLVHKRGILSNFNLLENKNRKDIVPVVMPETTDSDEEFQGIFTRNMEVADIYSGIETISRVYGFAGIEPNSVMLGWARNTKRPEAFAELVHNFKELDYNLFILDYNKKRGYGTKSTIDLWWRGGSNNFSLGLTLIKFLQMSDDWEESEARIFIVIEDSSLKNRIYKNVANMLDEQRIQAKLVIVNNAIEHTHIKDIVKRESSQSDLVIIGIPEVRKDTASGFIADTDQLIESLGSVILVQASSFFKPIFIGIEETPSLKKPISTQSISPVQIPPLELPHNEILKNSFQVIDGEIKEALSRYRQNCVDVFISALRLFIEEFEQLIQKNLNELKEGFSTKELHRSKKYLARMQSNFLFNSRRTVQHFQNTVLGEQRDNLASGLQTLVADLQAIVQNTTDQLIVVYEPSEKSDTTSIFKKSRKPVRRKLDLQLLLNITLRQVEQDLIFTQIADYSLNSYALISDIHKFFISALDSIDKLESLLLKKDTDQSLPDAEVKGLHEQLKIMLVNIESQNTQAQTDLYQKLHQVMRTMIKLSEKPNINRLAKRKLKKQKKQPHPEKRILQVPDSWYNNQELLINFFIEDLYLKQFQNRIETILRRFFSEIQISIDTNYLAKLESIEEILNSIIKNPESKHTLPSIVLDGILPPKLFNTLLADIQSAGDELPENIEVMSEESFQNIEKDQFADISTVKINLRRHAQFLVETELVDALQEQLNGLTQALHKNAEAAQEVVRFTNFNLSQSSESPETHGEPISIVAGNGLKRIAHEKDDIHKRKQQIQDDLKHLLQSAFEKMNPYLISRSAGELVQTIRTQESRKIVAHLKESRDRVKAWTNNLVVRLVYQRSEGLLIAKKISKTNDAYQTDTGKILQAVRLLSPAKEVSQALPFYYKQLFLGKRTVNQDFLIDHPTEMEEAGRFIDIYNQGYRGALLILGEQNSGKSTLSRRISDRFFERKKIWQIFAPEGGSINPDDLRNRLAAALNQNGDFDSLFNGLPQKSVIILHDLELWWQRSPDGFSVLQIIVDLINRFSDRCLFIVNADTHSYNFINRLYNIENAFIGAMECQPFDSEELQRAIMLRHKSSGLKFEINGQPEEAISKLKLARMFNQYFDLSKGNIGLAISYWVSNIVKVNSQVIQIRDVVMPSEHALDKLSTDLLVILQQFHLHKQLSPARLMRIMNYDENSLYPLLFSLKRSGLILEVQPDILQISPFIQPQVQQRLREMDLL